MPERLRRIVTFAARHPGRVLLVAALLTLAAGAYALRLQTSTATETFVGKGSASYEASQRYYQRFGEDAVYVLVKGDLSKLVLTADLGRLLGLEGCMSGNVPVGVAPRGGPNGPCAELGRTKPVKVVFGPGTFINESVRQLTSELAKQNKTAADQADRAAAAARKLALDQGRSKAAADRFAKQARELVNAEFTRNVVQIALKYGLRSEPRLDDPNFVSTLVFDAARPAGTPKSRFAYLFPNKSSALIQVRLKPGLSQTAREDAIRQIRRAVKMPDWKLSGDGRYVVTGAPVVVNDLAAEVQHSIIVLLGAALLVMAATLALVFRSRLRLLPLLIALGAAALTFGGLSLAGLSLTMASIAVLPVLIGLAVDYAIQWQSRVQEADGDVRRAAIAGGPTIVTAAAATMAGFLVLLLSPVPMVRGFGVLLVIGIVLALGLTLLVATAALLVGRPQRGVGARARVPGRAALRGAGELLASAVRPLGPAIHGARRLLAPAFGPLARAAQGMLALSVRRPGRVLAVGAALALIGWGLDTQTRVESDITKLVPQNLSALNDLQALQKSTDVGGQLDVVVDAEDVADPAVIDWMTRYQRDVLARFGYSASNGCGKAQLCPAFSLPDLFRTPPKSRAQVTALLDAVPPYFSQSVIAPDRKTATLSFGIKLMPLEREQHVIDVMRERMHPPKGVHAELAGLPVLTAEANSRLSSPWRRLMQLVVGLLAVFLVLRVALRDRRRALIPLVPIVLASGWSALVLFAVRIPLNPMSVTLGALVIAISTEFSVLLSERYRQERANGHATGAALARTYRSTGAAVLASGATAIAGFAVLIVSDISMLRDFGFVTVIDLTVSLLGVLAVLPAVLVTAERGAPLSLPDLPWLRRPSLPRSLRRRARTTTAA